MEIIRQHNSGFAGVFDFIPGAAVTGGSHVILRRALPSHFRNVLEFIIEAPRRVGTTWARLGSVRMNLDDGNGDVVLPEGTTLHNPPLEDGFVNFGGTYLGMMLDGGHHPYAGAHATNMSDDDTAKIIIRLGTPTPVNQFRLHIPTFSDFAQPIDGIWARFDDLSLVQLTGPTTITPVHPDPLSSSVMVQLPVEAALPSKFYYYDGELPYIPYADGAV